jgi:hypothetical protein
MGRKVNSSASDQFDNGSKSPRKARATPRGSPQLLEKTTTVSAATRVCVKFSKLGMASERG